MNEIKTIDELIKIIREKSSVDKIKLCDTLNLNERIGDDLRTPLTYAAAFGTIEMIDFLLKNGALINYTRAWSSPLHEASAWGRVDIIKYLIEHGAQVNLQLDTGDTPLMCAAAHGEMDAVKLLLSYGANIYIQDDRGGNAIDVAGEKGEEEVENFLLSCPIPPSKI
ncbi:MAG: ankyrin repeat domain-containing protein [Sulfurovaceae bacterium]|jgi:ankyrin repeat protein|nr:ankyrin repeat domain-containing protein [Sulfurovaceae bacterium]MDD5548624.1 ankyrin repeat domain-containing protein [Sulfurovaceae bacterium]